MSAIVYGAEPILVDLVDERLEEAKELGIKYTINSGKENMISKVAKITNNNMAELVMECSGANAAIRSTIDIVANAGRITLTGWPKNELSFPTSLITKKKLIFEAHVQVLMSLKKQLI